MTPLLQVVIAVCLVVLTWALLSTLRALRKTADRAESVLHLVEREIRPLVSEIEGLTAELRPLLHNANKNMEGVRVIVGRVDDVTLKVARLVVALGAITRVGQVAGVATGVKRGVDVFVRRLFTRKP
ncbi:MAG TPA: DUF948 domain-containing protein [Methylomirabilota bacterium]|nr:DUF948 domain-containing protein [Methylomirabilota bacterium]